MNGERSGTFMNGHKRLGTVMNGQTGMNGHERSGMPLRFGLIVENGNGTVALMFQKRKKHCKNIFRLIQMRRYERHTLRVSDKISHVMVTRRLW
jgi:hypothetical protein